jgi:hypothetical protein
MSFTTPVCKCGKETDMRQVQSKGPNKDKWYFVCPLRSDKDKNHLFEWEEKPEAPKCNHCDSVCNKFMVKKEDSPNKGKWFFVCPERKGYGSEHMYKWEADWIEERNGQQSLGKEDKKPAKPERRSRSKSPSKKREESPLRERD